MKFYPPLIDAWYLTGPTAAGKSAVGIELARLLGAEIISLDSMAVYRGMDIGTAKPPVEERATVAHHLIDVVDPTEDFSLASYLERVHCSVAEIRQRGRQVLFVGGTPLYLKSLLRGVFDGPQADWELRRQLSAEAEQGGAEQLHRRLADVDAAAAAKLDPRDTRRVIRALEVFEKTGQPISTYQQQFDRGRCAESCRVFVLNWDRAVLHARIDARVEQMFAAGLVDEVRGLLERCGELSRTAAQAVGYAEVIKHLRGEFDLETALGRTKPRTRQFARRQLIWFRALSECRWLAVREPLEPNPIARQIVQQGGKVLAPK